MSNFNQHKYKASTPPSKVDRRWPDQVIREAPQWCSVDLRDGNQALMEPMSVAQKKRLFALLVRIGFKEIEVGFPAASKMDFDFVRSLIEEQLIPDDVTIQALTQCRDELIEATFQALQGVKRAVVHIYNSTSPIQRQQVFGLECDAITNIATQGAATVKRLAAQQAQTQWVFQYSPESFTGTESEYAVEICNAVIEVWQPTVEKPVIINLPATVEMSSPNIYADQIEWFADHVNNREALILSVHTHNDRGCAVAAAELALLAGADRVEGTLLGNGERTGNMDIVTMAMNLYSQGVDPGLNFSDIDEIAHCVEDCTQIPVHPRHPYVGEFVFTAFSGSHQDAIKKCLDRYSKDTAWEVAYLPIDPADLGRSYQKVTRINSQSGKGGVAYVLQRDIGLQMPRWLQIDFSTQVQQQAEETETELAPQEIWQLFRQRYIDVPRHYQLKTYRISRDEQDTIELQVGTPDGDIEMQGKGTGVLDALLNAVQAKLHTTMEVLDYSEHALSGGVDANAVAYLLMKVNGERCSGVAIHEDIVAASIGAVFEAVNQTIRKREEQAA